MRDRRFPVKQNVGMSSQAMSAALAVAAMTAAVLSVIHPLDASAMILLWNLGVALVFVAGGGLIGRRLTSKYVDATSAPSR
ncbi:DUF1109 family protein [Cupriavidus oxalaticus]|uniref:DUF1109 family protein n=1 Tax=Cupriavidus oxalaticus TaxID=96344 RepID=A0A4P7LFG3_9BURK|nr:DUF1109 family protein [Cupriavidus oxalaticus]